MGVIKNNIIKMSEITSFADFLSEHLPKYYMIHKEEFTQRMDILIDEYQDTKNEYQDTKNEYQEHPEDEYAMFFKKMSKMKKKELVDYIKNNDLKVKTTGVKQQLIERIWQYNKSSLPSNEKTPTPDHDKSKFIQKLKKNILNEYEWSDTTHFETHVMPKICFYYETYIKTNPDMSKQDFHRIFINIKKNVIEPIIEENIDTHSSF